MIRMDCDILVVGAGILGLSSAYHLKKLNPDKEVLTIDRVGGPGQGNSAKSEGGYRNLFSSDVNYLLAESTIEFMHYLDDELGYDFRMDQIGYLFLYSEEQLDAQKAALEKIERRGSEVRILEKRDLKEMIPELATDFKDDDETGLLSLEPVDCGVFGANCGSVDADALVRAYEAEYLRLGGDILYNVEAESLMLEPEMELGISGEPFVWQGVKIGGVRTSRGDIKAGKTVVAAGVWSERLLKPVGIDPYMRPKKRQIFTFRNTSLSRLFNVNGFNSQGVIPLTILPKASILFRPELSEGSIWLACADDYGRSFGLEDDPQAEEGYYTDNIYHVLVKYFSCFEGVRPANMWAGQYAVNSFDGQPVITGFEGMIYVGAASGSGIMKCDALGRIVAAKYEGRDEVELFGERTFTVSDLGIEKRKVESESLII
jgi:FAD-dependent oxidoreductase domain-containing protein 1